MVDSCRLSVTFTPSECKSIIYGVLSMSKKATSLEEFLASPESYDELLLNHKHITVDDCVRLGTALKSNKILKILELSNNVIGDIGATVIADGIKDMNSLICLSLFNSQIGDIGAAAIADGIKGMSSLAEVYLYNNQVGNSGAIAIATAFKDSTSLTFFYLHNNKISPDIVYKIKYSLRHVKYLSIDSQQSIIIEEEQSRKAILEEKTKIVSDDYVANEVEHVSSKEPLLKESLGRTHSELRLRKVKSDSTTVTELMTIPASEEQIETDVSGDSSWWGNCCDCCILL